MSKRPVVTHLSTAALVVAGLTLTASMLHASVNQADGGNLELQLSGSPKLVIDTSGNVGIGTTSPGGILDLTDGGIRTVFNGNRIERWDSDTDNAQLWLNWKGYNGGATRFRDTVIGDGKGNPVLFADGSTGNVGIGAITAPLFKLDVRGSIGNNGTMHHTSDRRLKKDIKPLTNSLEKVLALQGVQYRWKTPLDRPMEGIQIGVIAQDVQAVVPEVVLTAQNVSQTLSVNYDALTPLLIEAIKELKADNDNLREELNSLKAARQ